MKNKIRYRGHLKAYLRWPILLSFLLIIMNIAVYFVNMRAGTVVSIFTTAYLAIAAVLYFSARPSILKEMISFAVQYGQVQKSLMQDFVLPYALTDYRGRILWLNAEFMKLTGKDRDYRKSITSIISEISLETLPTDENPVDISFTYADRAFRANLKRVSIDELLRNTDLVEQEEAEKNYLIAVYLFDETELKTYIRKCEDETMVSGLLYLDNYEEALESVEDVRRSLLTALIDRKISKYFSEVDGLVKKLEKDKYFFVLKKGSLDLLKAAKFPLLQDVKTVNVGNEMAMTISIGIGMNAGSYIKNADFARTAIDLALGRGGDQVVIKNGDEISYFGGKTQAIERNTRVKARVKAHALKEIMSTRDKVVVMGHRLVDVDSFGASIGIYRAAKALNKRAYIVIDNPSTSIKPFMESFLKSQEHESDMFVDCHEAQMLVDEDTVLVVVDTNKPSYTECEALLSMTKNIVVLDHHRQGSEVIKNAVLSYIEPYASSACEMVAEILQYFADGIRIRNIEADSIYAGIIIDTDNFMQKTGVRTFEAAAFLRRCGADVTRVRRMFREKIEVYRARGETISDAELYRGEFAISICPAEGLESPTIVGAQAANELLNIVGVKASFVLTEYKGTIYISARAIDEVNVQLVMERMGGGGHMNIAGAQLANHSIPQARAALKDTLNEMLNGGEI